MKSKMIQITIHGAPNSRNVDSITVSRATELEAYKVVADYLAGGWSVDVTYPDGRITEFKVTRTEYKDWSERNAADRQKAFAKYLQPKRTA